MLGTRCVWSSALGFAHDFSRSKFYLQIEIVMLDQIVVLEEPKLQTNLGDTSLAYTKGVVSTQIQ